MCMQVRSPISGYRQQTTASFAIIGKEGKRPRRGGDEFKDLWDVRQRGWQRVVVMDSMDMTEETAEVEEMQKMMNCCENVSGHRLRLSKETIMIQAQISQRLTITVSLIYIVVCVSMVGC